MLSMETDSALVRTIGDRCKVCFTCVRECPAKAIRILSGQAEVISDRCICCGNCIRVCSQKAKQFIDSSNDVIKILDGAVCKVACIAPSFVAEFTEVDATKLVGALRSIGFDHVLEVAFGADLVARQYRRNFHDESLRSISSTCPAIVSYIEKYHPDLTSSLATICSPMTATGRIAKRLFGNNCKTVFIGPCIAKKAEAKRAGNIGSIDSVITYSELRNIFALKEVVLSEVDGMDFDEPRGGLSTIFPIGRGFLQAAGLGEDLLNSNLISADGAKHFIEAIKGFENSDINARLVDLLCCQGCIVGPGFSTPLPLFKRREAVVEYARAKMATIDDNIWLKWMEEFEYLDLSTSFIPDDHRLPAPSQDEITRILLKMGKDAPGEELNCGACGYDTCIEHAIAIHQGLAEHEMCLPSTIDKLKTTAGELTASYDKLSQTKRALLQSEKLASMGQLAAGIAHEVNNPLGVVLLYAHLLKTQATTSAQTMDDIDMILEQAERCKTIVSGLLNFARKNKVSYRSQDIAKLLDRAESSVIVPKTVRIIKHVEPKEINADMDSDQMIQVLTNMMVNSFEAMTCGGLLSIKSYTKGESVIITIEDNGIGIDEKTLPKIFEPFFTTKQIGKGTGLGLAVAYGIVKMHRGNITAQSNSDPEKGQTGTTFKITLPMRRDSLQ